MAEDRNDIPSDIVHISAPNLALYADTGGEDSTLDAISEKQIVPIATIIHGTHPDDVIDRFGLGSICVPSNGLLLARKDSYIDLVPVYFYTEYIKWADQKDTENSVMDRTFDAMSDIARRSMSKETWQEPYQDGKFNYSYVEHYNYVMVPYGDHVAAETPIIFTLSRAEATNAKKFNSAIRMRKITVELPDPDNEGETIIKRVTPKLFTQIWRFTVSQRSKSTNKWYGYNFDAPDPANPDANFIKVSEVPFYQELHEKFRKLHSERAVHASYVSDPPIENAEVVTVRNDEGEEVEEF